MAQGKLRIDRQGPSPRVFFDPAGVTLLSRDAAGATQMVPGVASWRPLAELEQLLRKSNASPASPGGPR
jgi:hypothetical protein